MNINSAFELEKLEEYINLKSNDLNEIYELKKELNKKYESFINDYNNRVFELNELINKKCEDIHNLLNSFEYSFNNSLEEIKNLEKELTNSNNFESEDAKLIELNLMKKLQSEKDKLSNEFNNNIELLNVEYKKGKDVLSKIEKKINKIKTKDIEF